MFSNTPFYHSSIRTLITAFADLFNNIKIRRIESDGTVAKTIKVPISFASGDKTIKTIQQSYSKRIESIDTKITLPRLAFNMTGLSYNSARAVSPMNQNIFQKVSDDTKIVTQYHPAPWDFNFTLSAYVKYEDDGLQILEQILPYFKPSCTLTIKDIIEIGLKRDVPIDLVGVSRDWTYEGDATEDSIYIWNLEFTAKSHLYMPIADSNIIKTAYTNIRKYDNGEKIVQIAVSVDPLDANRDDDWTVLRVIDEDPEQDPGPERNPDENI